MDGASFKRRIMKRPNATPILIKWGITLTQALFFLATVWADGTFNFVFVYEIECFIDNIHVSH